MDYTIKTYVSFMYLNTDWRMGEISVKHTCRKPSFRQVCFKKFLKENNSWF